MPREVTDVEVRPWREREGRALDRHRRQRDLVGPVAVYGFGAGPMAVMEVRIADEPFVVDGVVVHDRERDRHAGLDLDRARLEARVVDPDADLCRHRGLRRGAGARRECGERERHDHLPHRLTGRGASLPTRRSAPRPRIAMPTRASGWSDEELVAGVVGLAGASSPAATRDGTLPFALIARS